MKCMDTELNIDISLQQGTPHIKQSICLAFINLPCLILDLIKRIRPSSVLGPVLASP